MTMSPISVSGQKEGMPIQLFSTPDGIRAVDSPVRVSIISMLKEREMGFDEIVASSKKAKSTVSVHLQSLVKEGIVSSKPDPLDARKKIFYIDAHFLGGLERREKLESDMKEYMLKYAASAGEPFEFFRLMFRTIRVALINEGIDIDPILHKAGTQVGEALYSQVADPDIKKLLNNLAKFWEQHKLGRLKVKGLDPIVIVAYDCFECQDLPYLGRPACAFDSGILEAVFSAYYKDERLATETNCYAMGDSFCRFVIKRNDR
jgi:predicted hydrocarbon binding protein